MCVREREGLSEGGEHFDDARLKHLAAVHQAASDHPISLSRMISSHHESSPPPQFHRRISWAGICEEEGGTRVRVSVWERVRVSGWPREENLDDARLKHLAAVHQAAPDHPIADLPVDHQINFTNLSWTTR